jgi:hypothetical protein
VQSFQPDQLVIAEACSSWLRLGLVDKARAAYPIPVTRDISPAGSRFGRGTAASELTSPLT